MKAQRATPTPEQLALAFRQVRRPGWPPTLEEALARPAYATALHCLAGKLGRVQPTAGTRPPGLRTAPVPPTPTAANMAHKPSARGVDRKRAAANDLDD